MASEIKVDTVSEKTSGSGVTIDSVVHKDSAVYPSSADGGALGSASNEWSDLFLADSSVIKFGADQDTTLTHTDGTGLTLNSTNKLTFGDAASYIQQSSDGVLKINGEATVDIDATAAITLAAAGVPVTVGGIPFYTSNTTSIYTHDVSGTDDAADYNTAYGRGALDDITTGDKNVAIGYGAGSDVSTGGDQVFIGVNAGNATTTGTNNVAIGNQAYYQPDTEGHNIAIGTSALAGPIAGGEHNIAIGVTSGDAITSGDNNVLLGSNAGTAITTGSLNTAMGVAAMANVTTGSSNISIGNSANMGAVDSANAICIGIDISAASNDFVFGKASNAVTNDFDTDANWSRSSDVRKKREIYDQELGLDFINYLRTVRFQWKPSNEFPKEWNDYNEENNMNTDAIMHGFIAQEVKAALDKHASDNDKKFSGWKEGDDGMQHTSREMFVIPLIKAVQELSAQVSTLQNEINTLKGE